MILSLVFTISCQCFHMLCSSSLQDIDSRMITQKWMEM